MNTALEYLLLLGKRRTTFSDWLNATYPGTIMWHGQDLTPSTTALAYNRDVSGLADSSTYPGAELLVDGDMEAADFSAWIEGGNGTYTKEAGARTGGSGTRIARVARNLANNPYIQQNVLTVGKRYLFSGWPRSDGNATALVWIGGSGNSLTGTTSTDWQYLEGEFVAGDQSVLMFTVTSTGTQYVEWDDCLVREVNLLNGDYSNVTLEQPFGGNIPLAGLYDGTSYTDIYSTALDSVFDGSEGTIIIFCRITDAGVWTDGVFRRWIRFQSDTNNDIHLSKNSTNNQLTVSYLAGGVNKTVLIPTSTLNNFMLALTYSKSNDLAKVFFNGAQTGGDLTGLGVWAGSLQSNTAVIGAGSNNPLDPAKGLITEVIVHPTRAMTADEIARIYNRSNI